MSLTTLPVTMFYPDMSIFNAASAPLSSSVGLGTSGYYICCVFKAPVTDTITKIGFFTGSINAGSYDVRVETVDSATGFPSGTLWATNTNFVQTVAATDDVTWFEVTLTAGASVNRGDPVAVMVKLNETFTGNLGQMNNIVNPMMPTYVRNSTGTPGAISGNLPIMSVHYSATGYVHNPGILPVKSVALRTFNNGSTTDVYGNKITLLFSCKVGSVCAVLDLDGDVTAKLYDSDGVTVLASASFGVNLAGQTGPTKIIAPLDSEVTLQANTAYYLGFEPSSSSNITAYSMTFPDENIKKCYVDSSVVAVSAKDPSGTGSWTVDTTQCIVAGIGISAIETGGGGGSIFGAAGGVII